MIYPSSQPVRFSAGFERMMKSFPLFDEPSRLALRAPTPAPLDVTACYNQLNKSENQCPVDAVMREALDLYCSLISPPLTPRGYSDRHVVPPGPSDYSGLGRRSDASRFASLTSPSFSSNTAVEFGRISQDGFPPELSPFQEFNYELSTPSPSSSGRDSTDSSDLDDPFASYPLSQAYFVPGQQRKRFDMSLGPHHRSLSEGPLVAASNAMSSASASQAYFHSLPPVAENIHQADDVLSSKQSHWFAPIPSPSEHEVLSDLVTVDLAQRKGIQDSCPPHSISRATQRGKPAESKPPTPRKRAFSVASFGRHRKTSSIATPEPILVPNDREPAQTRSSITSHKASRPGIPHRINLLKATENSHISDIEPRARAKSISNMASTVLKTNPHPPPRDGKSLWKALKTKTSRSSLNIERTSREMFTSDASTLRQEAHFPPSLLPGAPSRYSVALQYRQEPKFQASQHEPN